MTRILRVVGRWEPLFSEGWSVEKKTRKKRLKGPKAKIVVTALTKENRRDLKNLQEFHGWNTISAMLRVALEHFIEEKPWLTGFKFETPPHLFTIRYDEGGNKILVESEFSQYNVRLTSEMIARMDQTIREIRKFGTRVSRRTFIYSLIQWLLQWKPVPEDTKQRI